MVHFRNTFSIYTHTYAHIHACVSFHPLSNYFCSNQIRTSRAATNTSQKLLESRQQPTHQAAQRGKTWHDEIQRQRPSRGAQPGLGPGPGPGQQWGEAHPQQGLQAAEALPSPWTQAVNRGKGSKWENSIWLEGGGEKELALVAAQVLGIMLRAHVTSAAVGPSSQPPLAYRYISPSYCDVSAAHLKICNKGQETLWH